jgi:hypothetical protein
MVKIWRPLTQEELPYLASGDTLTLRLNYLYNPKRLPVPYVAALCLEKRKRDGTFLVEGTVTPISMISPIEAGRFADDGWQMSGEELSKLKLYDLVIIHKDSSELRRAQYMGGAKPFLAKVIYDGETVESLVVSRQIGPVG